MDDNQLAKITKDEKPDLDVLQNVAAKFGHQNHKKTDTCIKCSA